MSIADVFRLKLDRAIITCRRLEITPEQAIAVMNFADCRKRLCRQLSGTEQFDKAFGLKTANQKTAEPEPLGSDW